MGNITLKEKPDSEDLLLNILSPTIKKWFFSRFKDFSLPQRYAVYDIHCRQNILVSAPTGATKTLTGFLSVLNELVDLAQRGQLEDKTYCVYISPLKALNYDIEHNLNTPLSEIEALCGKKLGIRVGVRTGDTSVSERAKMMKSPPHILITTPESLAILLQLPVFKGYLAGVEWTIIDEIHALAENKRGVHLSLAMELLQLIAPGMCRVGLSATIAPLEHVAGFLVGSERDCRIVNVQFLKELDLKVLSPVPDLIETSYDGMQGKLYDLIDDLIQQHKTTLIFTNTRAATERVVHHLKDAFPKNYTDVLTNDDDADFIAEENTKSDSAQPVEDSTCSTSAPCDMMQSNLQTCQVSSEESYRVQRNKVHVAPGGSLKTANRRQGNTDSGEVLQVVGEKKITGIGAHHGSLSKTHRHKIEDGLRKGLLKCVVCSTSLELGIDIGYIDLVILLGSPKSVARALQRVGRSGHQLHATTKGRIIVLDRDDLVECSVLLKSAVEKKIDKIHIPKNCLDVLAQQIYGFCISESMTTAGLYAMIKKSYCYSDLSSGDFYSVISYLAGEHVSLEDRHVYAKIWYDREQGIVGRKGKLARVIYMTNIGTIPEETGIAVKVGSETIGVVDEPFLERLKRGDIFVLGGSTYQFLFSRGMVAQVSAASGRKPTVPSWVSEMLPLSFDLAGDIGKFRSLVRERLEAGSSKKDIIDFINSYLYVDENGASAIYYYMKEQYDFAQIPTDRIILIENYSDDEKKYSIFHCMYGRRVNDCLSRAVAYVISKTQKVDVEVGVTDNGFYVAAKKTLPAARALSMLESKRLSELLNIAIDKTQILSRRFRHCAARSLMILRSYKGNHKRVGKQQVSSMILMSAVKRISKDFPILKEARREVLEDLMDIDNASRILRMIENSTIKVKGMDTMIPSPFSFNIILQGHLDMVRIEDRIDFLKRMHKMVLAKISLDKGKKDSSSQDKSGYEGLWNSVDVDADRSKTRERLAKQLDAIDGLPPEFKKDLHDIIGGEIFAVSPEFWEYVKNNKFTIEKSWPRDLRIVVSSAAKRVENELDGIA